MKFVKDSIKGIAEKNMDNIEAKMKEVMAEKRKILNAEKRERADNSFRFAYV